MTARRSRWKALQALRIILEQTGKLQGSGDPFDALAPAIRVDMSRSKPGKGEQEQSVARPERSAQSTCGSE